MKTGARTNWEVRSRRFRLIVLLVPIALIVAFHAILLMRRVGDASIMRPAVLAQWAFAALLLIAVSFFRRLLSRNGGHRLAVIFWILVAILHLAPAGERYFNTHQDVALLVEVGLVAVPAMTLLAVRLNRASDALPQFGWIGIDLHPFASFNLPTSCSDRAPPLH